MCGASNLHLFFLRIDRFKLMCSLLHLICHLNPEQNKCTHCNDNHNIAGKCSEELEYIFLIAIWKIMHLYAIIFHILNSIEAPCYGMTLWRVCINKKYVIRQWGWQCRWQNEYSCGLILILYYWQFQWRNQLYWSISMCTTRDAISIFYLYILWNYLSMDSILHNIEFVWMRKLSSKTLDNRFHYPWDDLIEFRWLQEFHVMYEYNVYWLVLL